MHVNGNLTSTFTFTWILNNDVTMSTTDFHPNFSSFGSFFFSIKSMITKLDIFDQTHVEDTWDK